MGGLSWVHWVILGLVIVILFGKGKVSGFMEDLGKGIHGFKKGLRDGEAEAAREAEEAKRLSDQNKSGPA